MSARVLRLTSVRNVVDVRPEIPKIPPMDYARLGRLVLAKTVDRLGGVPATAYRLDIGTSLLKAYLDGDRPIPDEILLIAADLILEELPTLIHQASGPQPDSRPSS
jgi:hypothetical protein